MTQALGVFHLILNLMPDEFLLVFLKIFDATDRVQNCNILMFKSLNKSGAKVVKSGYVIAASLTKKVLTNICMSGKVS